LSGVTELFLIGVLVGAILVLWPLSACSGSDTPRDGARLWNRRRHRDRLERSG
jgi:hypothetical protein